VEIEYTASHLRILVRDNGCGMDPQVRPPAATGHWGLSGMRERAERICGKLRVLSMASAGTEIHLSVPGRLAFEPEFSTRRIVVFQTLFAKSGGRQGSNCAQANSMTEKSKIRVLSVDDHPLLREGISAVINSQPDMLMIADAASAHDGILHFASTDRT